ncbi:hypothetical protein CAOG_02582 [Capsaspora owczarzaki ATCC 30864]|uniref:Uncharacterized protein n=1 Tax=Capsaspora owczarzaki (strain ATCC 30864) TaxID=595528 RepID=A0A0D2X1V1_CAPO3|nr:hypothetical protein CAOG_02582 [Capsaspora owczarzaki ATCC 30864]KJE91449.1 hypothetical protein CAOG_002582 [Capsaspora owczarzaki ATCC 30864]|eukprot:XP_004349332.1 hypothetical protein CAOG_02582 [Capsaspora owczarzaki ATCC 30864]
MSAYYADLHKKHRFYHGPLGRIEAERKLKSIGFFLIRDSSSVAGDLVLSVRERSGIRHFMIKKRNNRFKIGEQGYSFEFPQLIDLVDHFMNKPLNENCLTTPVERENDSRNFVGEATALYNFEGGAADEVRFSMGEILRIIEFSTSDWWLAQSPTGQIGLIPANFVKLQATPPAPAAGSSSNSDAFSAMRARQAKASSPPAVGPAVLPGIALAMKEAQQQQNHNSTFRNQSSPAPAPAQFGRQGSNVSMSSPQQSSAGRAPAPIPGGSSRPPVPPPAQNNNSSHDWYQNRDAVANAFGGSIPQPPPPAFTQHEPPSDDLYQNQSAVLKHLNSDAEPEAPVPAPGGGAPRPSTGAAKPSPGEYVFVFDDDEPARAPPAKTATLPKPAAPASAASGSVLNPQQLDDFLTNQFADLQSELDNVLNDFGDLNM